MPTLKRLHRQAKSRRQGRPAFTLLELIVVLLVLGILAAIAVPTFNTVKENSVKRAAQTTLEAIDRNGEAIAISDPDLSDAQVASAALDEIDTPEGMTITSDGEEVTVELTRGSISASGTVTFSNGVGTIVAATTGSGSSSTTSTTAASTTTTTTVALTCATGGTCVVGDTGPGGGIVFYVHSSGTFTSTGSDCGSNCNYLEAAPNNWNGADPARAWSGNTNTLVGTNTGLGTGYQNTSLAFTQNSTADRAITLAWNYSNNSKTDWHLPSRDELKELYKYARQQTTGNTLVACTGSGSLRTGFAVAFYWSSSEGSASNAWHQDFNFGNQFNDPKVLLSLVRPVRAF